MADTALFIGWGNPVRGREAKALEVFGESVAYWQGLQEAGTIESVQTFLLEAHGGDLAGFAILGGDAESLAGVRGSEDFQRLVARAGLIVENLGVVTAMTGGGLDAQMGIYGEAIAAIT
jgi:hypothetical protein